MRELRALGLTDDGKSLVLVDLTRGAEGERFRVNADERLRAALRSGAPRAAVPQAETRVESALSVREIQSRLRAGATAEEVAKAAGIPVNRVLKYEAPILGERARVVSEARNASAPGPHRNTPGRPLGALVDDRLEQESLDPTAVEWDAQRRPDGTWLVTLAMEPRGPRRATWSWDPQARRVRAADAGATAMLAPMPAPTAGPDSLTALAEAAGVAAEQSAEQEQMAVGDDVRRRAGGGRTQGRPNSLVVLAGRGDDVEDRPQAAPRVDTPRTETPRTEAPRTETPATTAPERTAAGLDSDVPGGSSPVPAPSSRPERPRVPSAEALLPGTEPASGLGTTSPRPDSARPVRQERFGDEAVAEPAPAPTLSRRAPDGPAAPARAGGATEVLDEPLAVKSPTVEADTAGAGNAEPVGTGTTGAPTAAKGSARAGSSRRRSAVPAWDDIMFGARRG